MVDRLSVLGTSLRYVEEPCRRPRSGFDYECREALIEESLGELVSTVPGP